MWWDNTINVTARHGSASSGRQDIIPTSSEGCDASSGEANELENLRVAVSSDPESFSRNMSALINSIQLLEQNAHSIPAPKQQPINPIPVITYQILGLLLGYVVIIHCNLTYRFI